MHPRNECEMVNPMTLEKFVSYLAFHINICNELRERYPEDYGAYYQGKEDAFRSMWVLAKGIRKLRDEVKTQDKGE